MRVRASVVLTTPIEKSIEDPTMCISKEPINSLRANSNTTLIMNEWTLLPTMALAESIEIDAVLLFLQSKGFSLRVPQAITSVTDLNTSL